MTKEVQRKFTIVIDRKFSEGRILAIDLFARLIADNILRNSQQNNDSGDMTETDRSSEKCQIHMS